MVVKVKRTKWNRKNTAFRKPINRYKPKANRYTLEKPVPPDLLEGVIMSIDPGTQRLGWSITSTLLCII